jgi:hypothetical protein
MEINLTGAVIALLVIGCVASILCMGLLLLLNSLKILRFHEKSGVIFYGIIGGIIITFLLFKRDFGCSVKNNDRTSVETGKLK